MNPTEEQGVTARTIFAGWLFVFSLLAVAAALVCATPYAYAAKGGVPGKPGGDSGPKVTGPTATVSGTVTNNYDQPVAGAEVSFTTLTASFPTTTDGNGEYSIKVPANNTYDVSVTAQYHEPYMKTGSVFKGKNNPPLDVVLQAEARVIVEASVTNTAVPDGDVTAMGSYIILDGSMYESSGWSQGDEGVPAMIISPESDTTDVTLGTETEYAEELIKVLTEAPITEGDVPPDLELQPINEIQKGLQDRNQVVAVNPFALEKAEAVPLIYTVTTSSGDYTAEVDVLTHLPWQVSTGVKTVPVNVPVLLLAKCGEERNEAGEYECVDRTVFDWMITEKPLNSTTAALTDADTRSPWFTPDVVGVYRVQEMNGSGADLYVHVGRYHGVIDPVATLDELLMGDGRPVADKNCTSMNCHSEGGAAPPNFDTWRNTGHAEAFSQGITTNDHFGERCFACHAVGFGQGDAVSNAGGIDFTPNYDNFLDLLAANQAAHDIEGTWETMLIYMPDTARMSNIQCENCHGPQDYAESHRDQPGAPRVSLASDVCGSCHGEPFRHGRFQQWQLSNHADYELAVSRSENGNCARCHSGNGFVAWSKLGSPFKPDENVDVTWTEDEIVPQTCPACHNPHDTGTTSGSDETNAKVRVNNGGVGGCDNPSCNTYELIAGFTATNVGKGATCMTCHNSRRGLRNDQVWDSLSNSQKDDTPHHGVQADLIMGQNMFFFDANDLTRGKHSLIEDTCVTCHMNKTQPPDILSYNQQGTNHTFAADPNICSECHGPSDPSADNIDAIITTKLDVLKAGLGAAWERIMQNHYPVAAGACSADGVTTFVTDVEWVLSRGTRLNITVTGGTTCSNVNPNSVDVDGGAQSLYDVSFMPDYEDVWKAAWNYGMLWEDQTINEIECPGNDPDCEQPHTARGVHNPDFCIKGLERAISAVQAVSP